MQVNNGCVKLSLYKLSIQYIKGIKNILANCLSCLVATDLTDHDYEPEGQEFGKTLFEGSPPITKTKDSANIFSLDICSDTLDMKILKKRCIL